MVIRGKLGFIYSCLLSISCLQTNENTVVTSVLAILDAYVSPGMIGGQYHPICNKLHLHVHPGNFLEICPTPMYIQAA